MREFKGNLGKYKVVPTEDNSLTVYSEYFDEACHNLSGAFLETVHNYIQGCNIPELIDQKKEFAVLDVGFGVGVGLFCLMDELKNHSSAKKAFYYSIELDESFFLWSVQNTFPEMTFIRQEEQGLIFYLWETEQVKAKIFIGDGRITLPKAAQLNLIKPLDVIFQDPFSPKKNPTLWSVEWFLFLKSLSKPAVAMSTYSSSISIRKSMIAAGWKIENAKGFAQKRTMTKANLTGETESALLEQLARSPSLEIHDK